MKKNIVQFLRQKDYAFVKDIGQGGLGKTVLLKDETIGEQFVCKKYSPAEKAHKEVYFRNFVQEIKLLHLLYHRNIVRVFNYHLYPDQVTGYILMEFIDGDDIESYLRENPDKINSVFTQTIEGFKYLEQINILHRDIRPLNILVSNDGTVKIIDFGFGKKIEFDDPFDKSITLNWPYSIPDEFGSRIYDFKTEIYFVAKLFETIIIDYRIKEFAYKDVLKAMVQGYDTRTGSFFDVSRRITEGGLSYVTFQEYEKETYREFAINLVELFSRIDSSASYVTDTNKILQELENVYQSSMLEEYVQNVVDLTGCFVKGKYGYFKNHRFEVRLVLDFTNLLRGLSLEKQKIVMTHLWKRLDTVTRAEQRADTTDDLPF